MQIIADSEVSWIRVGTISLKYSLIPVFDFFVSFPRCSEVEEHVLLDEFLLSRSSNFLVGVKMRNDGAGIQLGLSFVRLREHLSNFLLALFRGATTTLFQCCCCCLR